MLGLCPTLTFIKCPGSNMATGYINLNGHISLLICMATLFLMLKNMCYLCVVYNKYVIFAAVNKCSLK